MDATTKAIALLDCIAFYMHLEMGLIYFQIQQKDCLISISQSFITYQLHYPLYYF